MRAQDEILEAVRTIRNTELSVYIWGAGKIGTGVGRELLRLLDINVSGYCDTDSKKWGQEFEEGVFCLSPEELQKQNNKACFVMVGQYYKDSVLKSVKEVGFDIIVDYDELCSLDVVIDKFISQRQLDKEYQNFINRELVLMNNEEYEGIKISNPSGKKIAVYTCIAGDYDDVVEPEVISEQCDYYLISDRKPNELKVYQWIDINNIVPNWIGDNRRRNRYCKINVEEIFSSYPYSIYVDGNVKIVGEIEKYIDCIGTCGFASHKHDYNNCLYVEAIKVVAAKVEDEKIAIAQVKKYQDEGMPRNYGQFQNAILVRDNNNSTCKKLMNLWWKEVFTKSYRDQLSLTYCLWKCGISKEDVGVLGNNMRKNKDFVWVKRHHV